MQIIDCLAITAVQCFFVLLTEMPSKPQSNSIYHTFTGWGFFPHWVYTNCSPFPHSYMRSRKAECTDYRNRDAQSPLLSPRPLRTLVLLSAMDMPQ